MSLRHLFNPLVRKFRAADPSRKVRRQRLCRPKALPLEDRVVPTVYFEPAFGPETVIWRPNNSVITQPMLSNPTVLNNPQVNVIFCGSSWGTLQGLHQASVMFNRLAEILGSNYLSGLTEYGSDGKATLGSMYIDIGSSLESNAANADAVLQFDIQDAGFPLPGGSLLTSPIYVVVFDAGGSSGNGVGHYLNLANGADIPTNHIWIGLSGPGSVDAFTDLISHELVDRISDGTGQGIGINTPVGSPNYVGFAGNNSQLADNEPDAQRYTYRLNGSVLVQAYWSIKAQAFQVPDGSNNILDLTPHWHYTDPTNAVFDGKFDVTIHVNSAVTVDSNTLLTRISQVGHSWQLDSSGLVRIEFPPLPPGDPGGNIGRQFDIHGAPPPITFHIQSSGSDTINLGNSGNLDGFKGNLLVDSLTKASNVTLNVDDSANPSGGRTFTSILDASVSYTKLRFFPGGVVSYGPATLKAMTIRGGYGANTFNVLETIPSGLMTIDTGYGNDAVNVRKTSGQLEITSSATAPTLTPPQNVVTLGSLAPRIGGSLIDFNAITMINPLLSRVRLILDDSKQLVGQRHYTVSDSSVTDGDSSVGPAAINFAGNIGDVQFFTGGVQTTLDIHSFIATSRVICGSNSDIVNIGDMDHNLNAITGTLNVIGNNKTAVSIDDRGNVSQIGYTPQQTSYSVNSGLLTRQASAWVTWPPSPIYQAFYTSIAYSGLDSLTVHGSRAVPANYEVKSISPIDTSHFTINSNGRSDYVTIGTPRSTANLVQVDLNVVGNGMTQMVVDDRGPPGYTPQLTQYGVYDNAVQRTVTSSTVPTIDQTFHHQRLKSLALLGGLAGPFAYQVNSTQGADGVTLNAGTTLTAVNIGSPQTNLTHVKNLTVNGNGNTTLTEDERGNKATNIGGITYQPAKTQYVASDKQLARSGTALVTPGGPQFYSTSIKYDGLSALTIEGGPVGNYSYEFTGTKGAKVVTLNGGDTGSVALVRAATSDSKLTLNTGGGNDSITVGSAANSLDPITGPVTVNGQGGFDTLNYNDQARASSQYYYSWADHLERVVNVQPFPPAVNQVYYGTVEHVVVNGGNAGSSGNFMVVRSSAVGTTTDLYPGPGNANWFIVQGKNFTTNDILGPVNYHGSGVFNNAEAYDTLDTIGHTINFTGTTYQQENSALVTFDNVGQFIVATGSGADTVNINGVAAKSSLNLSVANNDIVNVGGAGAVPHTLQAIAGTVAISSPAASPGLKVNIDDSGNASTTPRTATFDKTTGSFYFVSGLAPALIDFNLGTGSSIAIKGNGADENFIVKTVPPNPALSLDGYSGADTLDYSTATASIAVNVTTGAATSFAGGIQHIRNVKAGSGNDVLVGDSNANILTGGGGRNVIFGGAGADQPTGGSGENILVGGTTDFDANAAALSAILQEWSRTDIGFSTRVNDLITGVGPGNIYALNNLTVHGDGAVDSLFRGGGRTWYLVSLGQDLYDNDPGQDTVTFV